MVYQQGEEYDIQGDNHEQSNTGRLTVPDQVCVDYLHPLVLGKFVTFLGSHEFSFR